LEVFEDLITEINKDDSPRLRDKLGKEKTINQATNLISKENFYEVAKMSITQGS